MLFVLLSWFVTHYAKYVRIRPAVGVRLTGGGLFEFLIAMRKAIFKREAHLNLKLQDAILSPFLLQILTMLSGYIRMVGLQPKRPGDTLALIAG